MGILDPGIQPRRRSFRFEPRSFSADEAATSRQLLRDRLRRRKRAPRSLILLLIVLAAVVYLLYVLPRTL